VDVTMAAAEMYVACSTRNQVDMRRAFTRATTRLPGFGSLFGQQRCQRKTAAIALFRNSYAVVGLPFCGLRAGSLPMLSLRGFFK